MIVRGARRLIRAITRRRKAARRARDTLLHHARAEQRAIAKRDAQLAREQRRQEREHARYMLRVMRAKVRGSKPARHAGQRAPTVDFGSLRGQALADALKASGARLKGIR